MVADASIYGQIKPTQPLEGPLDQYGKVMHLKALMGQGRLQDLQTQQLEQNMSEEQGVRDVFKNAPVGGTLESLVPEVLRASPKAGIEFQGKVLSQQKTKADLEKINLEVTAAKAKDARDGLAGVRDQPSYDAWRQDAAQKGYQVAQSAPPVFDPTWQQQHLMTADKYIENIEHQKNRDVQVRGQDLSARTAAEGHALTKRGQDLVDARTRELNGIMDGQGTADLTPTATAIANHDIPLPNPPSGSRNPMAMVRYNDLVKKVKEINPTYNAPDYAASLKGVKDFGTGPYGQKVESSNTALNHLATLKGLAEAQKNGNMQLFNKIANEIGTASGQTAPTNLKAAITMVAPEIVKAVSGAGGGVEDRAKAAGALNPNYSPEQFLGAAKTMEELFGGRLSEAKRTYERTTFRKDFESKMLSPAAAEILKKRSQTATTASPAGPAAAGWKIEEVK